VHWIAPTDLDNTIAGKGFRRSNTHRSIFSFKWKVGLFHLI